MNPVPPAPPHQIQLKLREVRQLFNTLDPSPFRERDLDDDAEDFIVSWADELPVRDPLELVVHLAAPVMPAGESGAIEPAVQHYFAQRAVRSRVEFRRLMRDGWRSLLIGLFFLVACLVASEAIGRSEPHTLLSVLRESLVIGGWVAMWRPLEIYLYEWWPVRRRGRIFEKLSRMPVCVRVTPTA